jgi:hypothetical protein
MKSKRRSRFAALALTGFLLASPSTASAQARDSLWNGFGWGFLAGFGYGTVTMPGYLTYDALGWDRCRNAPNLTCSVPFGLVGGAIGALVDWNIKGTSVAAQPDVSRDRKALRVTIRF